MRPICKKTAIALGVSLAALMATTSYVNAQSCFVGASTSAEVGQIKAEGITFSQNGLGFGLLGGCAIAVDKFDVGARIAYDWSQNGGNDGVWQAVGTLGYRLNENVKPYLLAGYGGVKIDYQDYAASHRGLVAGAGLEIALGKNVALIAEYNRLWLSAKTFDDIKIDPGAHVVRVGVTYKLF
jgi:opacity protein-like surface antigen